MAYRKYTREPEDKARFTREFDQFYTSFAKVYRIALRVFPVWQRWLRHVLPHISGPRVLEISFGTGSLFPDYAAQYETWGVDYNAAFVHQAHARLEENGIPVAIQQADVEKLPYRDDCFDCLINTMAFTAYPDGSKALREMRRVLKPGGKLLMVDIDYPQRPNLLGNMSTRIWMALGDLIRDMPALFTANGFDFSDQEIGGWGSVHLYIATKNI